MTGEMKGEMKMAKSFYLKGLAPSDGRDEHDFVHTPSLYFNTPDLFFNNAALFAPIIPLLGIIYSQAGSKAFPA